MKRLAMFGLGAAVAALPLAATAGPTLDAVKARGELNCGVSTGTSIGKSNLDDQGH